MSMTSTISENIRCVAVTDSASAPTAAEVNAGHASGGGSPGGASSATSATAAVSLSITIGGLTSATAYDVYCATAAGLLSNKIDIYTSGFTVQPTKSSDTAGTEIGIAFTVTLAERVTCVVVLDGAAAPSAAEVNAETGYGGTAVAGKAYKTASALSSDTLSISGLAIATAYDVYCATASATLANKHDMHTSGFTVQPSAVSIQGSQVVASFTVTLAENVRCIVLASGATAPTATEVNAGTGNGGAAPVSNPAAAGANALSTSTITTAGLSPATDYDLYCATAAGVLATRHDFFSSGFSVQPAQVSISSSTIVVSATLTQTENVRCVAVADGASSPTAAQVTAGTDAGGSAASGSSSSTSATAHQSLHITISGLSTAVQYDAYCATAGNVLSTKLDFASSGYTSQPSLTNVQGLKVSISATLSATETIRCVAVADGATAPGSTQILAGQDSAGTEAPQSSIISCTGLSACAFELSGLTAGGSSYDMYCSTNGNTVSSKVDFTTLGDTDCDSNNYCSGHGTCVANVCQCQVGWGAESDVAVYKSPDCGTRVCPAGRSWADAPTSATKAHALAECSDAGVCDGSTGICECFEGYTGPACERTKCRNDCSGHGRCVTKREAASLSNAFPLVCYATSYAGYEDSITWDSDMVQGCVCDSSWSVGFGSGERQVAEYYGPGCKLRRCPSGNDPLTIADETNCEGKADNGKTHGISLTISQIVVSSSGATATVTHTATTTVLLAAGKVVTISGLPTTTALNNVWTVTGTPTRTTFTFAATERGFTSDGSYVEAGTATTCQGAAGNLCHVECSNRGHCNSATGDCECFAGFSGESCSTMDAQVV